MVANSVSMIDIDLFSMPSPLKDFSNFDVSIQLLLALVGAWLEAIDPRLSSL